MMNFSSGRCIAALLTFFSLSACGGGGGSSTPTPSPTPDELPLPENGNGTVSIDGAAVVITFSVNASDQVTQRVISGEVESTHKLTSANNNIVGAEFEATGSSVSLDRPDPDRRFNRLGNVALVRVTTADEVDDAIIIDRKAANQRFKYQTFGVWLMGAEPRRAGPGSFGAGTYGEPTSTNNVPSSGTATYSGASIGGGTYSGASIGEGWAEEGYYATTSEISVTTDFRTARITSSNTHGQNLDTDEITAVPELNFSGTANVTGAGFEATINGVEITNGKAYGHFYGPNAEEVGGTFGAELMGNGFYVGSFGAAQ